MVNRHKQACENEALKQQYNKQYADNRQNAKTGDINVGDCMLVRQQQQNKLTGGKAKQTEEEGVVSLSTFSFIIHL